MTVHIMWCRMLTVEQLFNCLTNRHGDLENLLGNQVEYLQKSTEKFAKRLKWR